MNDPKPEPAATNGKILVIDDSPIIQRTVYFQFRDRGFKVLMSGNLTESLAVVRAEKPDVILLDINFPAEYSMAGEVRDGFWATKWLHQIPEVKHIPVILISSADPVEAEPRALAAGAAAFMPKPLDHAKLLALIQNLIATKKPEASAVSSLKMAC